MACCRKVTLGERRSRCPRWVDDDDDDDVKVVSPWSFDFLTMSSFFT